LTLDTAKPLAEIAESEESLESRFSSKLQVNPVLNRQLVSFQANKRLSGYRWFKYKEGFSAPLINYIFKELGIKSGRVLDPFAGMGTTLFVAAELGLMSTGIELLPVGCEIIEARKLALRSNRDELVSSLSQWWKEKLWKSADTSRPFPHLRITQGAFPPDSEEDLCKFLALAEPELGPTRKLLRFAVLCILEEISFTRKDGQYLRWDERSGRRQGAKPFNKGHIAAFDVAIDRKLREICQDLLTPSAGLLSPFRCDDSTADIELLKGSCLEILPTMDENTFDCIVTSPPYCNRYDYTRTYALELAMLGVGEEGVRNLRQTMLSCTVENREKNSLPDIYNDTLVEGAKETFEQQQPLSKILTYLDDCKEAKLLNNDGIARMVRNYFWEMTLLLFEAARVLKPGSPFVMVNDNVRYQGATIPVDLILSDIAEKAGFEIERIWVLPNGKGNSSQQMGMHGREELRKSVYIWRVAKAKPAKMQNHQPVSQSLDSPREPAFQPGDR